MNSANCNSLFNIYVLWSQENGHPSMIHRNRHTDHSVVTTEEFRAKLRIVAIEVCWVADMFESVYDATNVSDCTVAPSTGNGLWNELHPVCLSYCFFWGGLVASTGLSSRDEYTSTFYCVIVVEQRPSSPRICSCVCSSHLHATTSCSRVSVNCHSRLESCVWNAAPV
jgi:hypothetical protein